MTISEILSAIEQEIARLQRLGRYLLRLTRAEVAHRFPSASRKRRRLNKAARKKIAAAQRKRWAAKKAPKWCPRHGAEWLN